MEGNKNEAVLEYEIGMPAVDSTPNRSVPLSSLLQHPSNTSEIPVHTEEVQNVPHAPERYLNSYDRYIEERTRELLKSIADEEQALRKKTGVLLSLSELDGFDKKKISSDWLRTIPSPTDVSKQFERLHRRRVAREHSKMQNTRSEVLLKPDYTESTAPSLDVNGLDATQIGTSTQMIVFYPLHIEVDQSLTIVGKGEACDSNLHLGDRIVRLGMWRCRDPITAQLAIMHFTQDQPQANTILVSLERIIDYAQVINHTIRTPLNLEPIELQGEAASWKKNLWTASNHRFNFVYNKTLVEDYLRAHFNCQAGRIDSTKTEQGTLVEGKETGATSFTTPPSSSQTPASAFQLENSSERRAVGALADAQLTLYRNEIETLRARIRVLEQQSISSCSPLFQSHDEASYRPHDSDPFHAERQISRTLPHNGESSISYSIRARQSSPPVHQPAIFDLRYRGVPVATLDSFAFSNKKA